jgi:hypothetical protein
MRDPARTSVSETETHRARGALTARARASDGRLDHGQTGHRNTSSEELSVGKHAVLKNLFTRGRKKGFLKTTPLLEESAHDKLIPS